MLIPYFKKHFYKEKALMEIFPHLKGTPVPAHHCPVFKKTQKSLRWGLLLLSPRFWGKAEKAGMRSITRVLTLAVSDALEAPLSPGHPSLPQLTHGSWWRGWGTNPLIKPFLNDVPLSPLSDVQLPPSPLADSDHGLVR